MNLLHGLFSLVIVVAMLALFVSWVTSRPRGRQLNALANVGEGRWKGGLWTALADAVIDSRYLVVKTGSDAYHIAVCTASDVPKGICIDEPGAIGDEVTVQLLGGSMIDTPVVQASGAVSVDDLVVPDAAGQVKTLPTSGGGTTYVIGKALSAATTAGDLIELIPTMPYKVAIPT